MADKDSYIHLARPLPAVSVPPAQATTSPLSVVISAQALFSILDHSLRRNVDQERVIGTLLGVRNEDGAEVEIRNCFAVGHNESQEQVEVDMDYHKTMLGLHLKANPKEVLIGWYATSPELNTFSALIQNFYASNGDGTFPHPAVHLTMSTVPGQDIAIRTYISSAVGVHPDRLADSCLFVPIPYEIKYADAERSGLELISSAKNNGNRSAEVTTDIHALEKALEEVLEMLDRVSEYVAKVVAGNTPASVAIGKFLMNTLSLAPKVSPADVERMFNTHIQDVLLVAYLANTIRTQIDLSNRLASANFGTTTTAPAAAAAGAAATSATTAAGGK